MQPKLALHDVNAADADAERHRGLAELADELMRRAHETNMPVVDEEMRVLMDVESNGIRCVLVRTVAPHEVPLLSPREQEIARMIACGLPNKTIASVLEISAWTVGTYLRRMFAKLHVTSRAAMVAKLGNVGQSRPRS